MKARGLRRFVSGGDIDKGWMTGGEQKLLQDYERRMASYDPKPEPVAAQPTLAQPLVEQQPGRLFGADVAGVLPGQAGYNPLAQRDATGTMTGETGFNPSLVDNSNPLTMSWNDIEKRLGAKQRPSFGSRSSLRGFRY